jgi:hypothetical protein
MWPDRAVSYVIGNGKCAGCGFRSWRRAILLLVNSHTQLVVTLLVYMLIKPSGVDGSIVSHRRHGFRASEMFDRRARPRVAQPSTSEKRLSHSRMMSVYPHTSIAHAMCCCGLQGSRQIADAKDQCVLIKLYLKKIG